MTSTYGVISASLPGQQPVAHGLQTLKKRFAQQGLLC